VIVILFENYPASIPLPALISGRNVSMQQRLNEWMSDLAEGVCEAVLESGSVDLARNELFPLFGGPCVLLERTTMLIRLENRLTLNLRMDRERIGHLVKTIGETAALACPEGWTVFVYSGTDVCEHEGTWSGTKTKGEVRSQTSVTN